ncbi:hypothetical protein [Sphingomonas sp. MMS24-J13]|uniref:hypothetical protein n=1 Tax=Sphingomonas sp. MMS24-J13 TaxID=3238686 RepID=UPI00384DCD79
MRSPSQRWRERGSRRTHIALAFDDIMEIALALLALSPAELGALGWSFADRKRLLDHFLASGKAAQREDPATLGRSLLELTLPLRDIRRLRTFVHRELPKAASNAALLHRLEAVLDAVP